MSTEWVGFTYGGEVGGGNLDVDGEGSGSMVVDGDVTYLLGWHDVFSDSGGIWPPFRYNFLELRASEFESTPAIMLELFSATVSLAEGQCKFGEVWEAGTLTEFSSVEADPVLDPMTSGTITFSENTGEYSLDGSLETDSGSVTFEYTGRFLD